MGLRETVGSLPGLGGGFYAFDGGGKKMVRKPVRKALTKPAMWAGRTGRNWPKPKRDFRHFAFPQIQRSGNVLCIIVGSHCGVTSTVFGDRRSPA